jgi:hypothetical protein
MTVQDLLHSFLDYKCLLLYCDWLGSDLRIGHFFYEWWATNKESHMTSFLWINCLPTQVWMTSDFPSNSIVTDFSSTNESLNCVPLYNSGMNQILNTTFNSSHYSVFIHCCINMC